MKPLIIPSIIAKEQDEFEALVKKAESVAQLMQLDIMDGEFVPNDSLAFEFLMPQTESKFEAHMMVNDPELWIDKFSDHADTLIPPIESCEDPMKIIELVKSMGKRVGFALNPATPIESITGFIDEIDQVIIMTVEPGFYGSAFVPQTLEKVRKLRKLRPDLDIEVDGSMNPDTIKQAYAAGANKFVVGSYLMKADDIIEATKTLKKILDID